MYCENCGFVMEENMSVCPICGMKSAAGRVGQYGAAGEAAAAAGETATSGVGEAVTAGAAAAAGEVAAAGASKAMAAGAGKAVVAKIGIAVAAVAVAGGGTLGVLHYMSVRDNGSKKVATDAQADVSGGTDTTVAAEGTTEVLIDEKNERYAAYYEVVKDYMEDYGDDFLYADLVDFGKSGDEQLVLGYVVEEEKEYEGYTYTSYFYYMTVYDYLDGKSKQILNDRTTCVQYGGGSVDANLEYVSNGEGVSLCSCVNETDYEAGGDYDITYTLYEYEDGAMNAVRTCSLTGSAHNGGGIYTVDGQTTDEAGLTAAVEDMTTDKDTYELAVGHNGMLYKDDYIGVTRTTIRKHDTINALAEAAGDSEFLNMEDKLQQPTDGQMVYNKYGEEYPYDLVEGVSSGSCVVEYSKDGAAFRVRDVNGFDDYCMVYENGVFKLVGVRYTEGDYGARWYADYDFNQNYESLMNNRDTCNITSDEYEQKVQELIGDGRNVSDGAGTEEKAVAAYKKLMTDALANGYMEWDNMRNGEPYCELVEGTGSADRDSFAIADIDDDGIPELLFKREEACMASLMQLVYRYNPSSDEVEQYFSLSINTTFYENGYIKEDSLHSQGLEGGAVWPHTWGTVKDGEFVYLYGIGGWDGNINETDFSGNPFPSEYDTDKNGLIYYVTDKLTDEETVMDDAQYNDFVDSLELGEERDLGYQSFTSANISSL